MTTEVDTSHKGYRAQALDLLKRKRGQTVTLTELVNELGFADDDARQRASMVISFGRKNGGDPLWRKVRVVSPGVYTLPAGNRRGPANRASSNGGGADAGAEWRPLHQSRSGAWFLEHDDVVYVARPLEE